ncbi:SGS domain-containing protein [Fimicolochytrium jonesii]|uniref:SGS domain-containing protein n=1 Tax=Fimicolochytrium jonesii TaxID=1396493 RepID=UPI0022FDCA91|nr:SGS domain-containing protein [Fimicolochytrium jonesii]KAI8818723.1 SGS domain-containing protein [Fimicolochytrium jonesii]
MTQSDPTTLLTTATSLFLSESYSEALPLYTQLISLSPTADAHLKRAACNHQLAHFDAAVKDADAALRFADDDKARGKALTRKGMALLELGRAQDAVEAFGKAREYGEGVGVQRWIEKCVAAGAKAPEPKVTAEPHKQPPQPATAPPTTIPTTIPTPASASKIRHEWFQNDSLVTVTIFVKNADPSNVLINFSERALSVTVKLPHAATEYSLELDPLAHEIVPADSKFVVMKTKVEITLRKKVVGVRWGELEGEETGPVGMIAGAAGVEKVEYPTSSKKKHNWDALAASVETDKPEGEQALNALFQQIYKDASDDTRRAMMKSYVESNGTVLSTNWEEIGKKKVEVTPPDGMIAKKHEL